MLNDPIFNFAQITTVLDTAYHKGESPSVTLISSLKKTPYHILVSTIISLRTKDQVTLTVSMKIFEHANSIEELDALSEERLSELLYPCGFYKRKANQLKQIARILLETNDGVIPDEIDELLKLPGVGRKTANLVVILGFNKPGICVDTHVHRISNRIGWVITKTPDDTEAKLREILPLEYWRSINDYMVSYGQTTCTPMSPHCSRCDLDEVCHHVGVERRR